MTAARVKLPLMRHLSYQHYRRTLAIALVIVTVSFLTLTHIPAARLSAHVKRSMDDDQHISHVNHPHHASVKKTAYTDGSVEIKKIEIIKGEKFLTYLPHDGFNNQRIELENAILLAHYLNRTLIVPPVLLGESVQWRPFDELSDYFAVNRTRTIANVRRCSNATAGSPVSVTPGEENTSECADFASWTTLPWTFFFDFNMLSDTFGVRFVHRNELHPRWFSRAMGIENPEQSPQIRNVKDNQRYDYRIYDMAGFNPQKGKYSRKLKLDRLLQVRAPVMQFGSLFGNGRVRADVPTHKEFMDLLDEKLVISSPTLQNAAMNIVARLGGPGKFVALHVRLGDSYFAYNIDATLKSVFQSLGEAMPASQKPLGELHVRPTSIHDRLAYCRRVEQPVIYMATDAPNPSFNPQLKSLYARYAPCIFTYVDFPSTNWIDLKNLPEVGGAGDLLNLHTFLEPIVDSIVAGHGSEVIGTPGSTFSAFVERLSFAWVGGPRRIKDGPLIEV